MDNNFLNFKIFDENFYHDNYLKFNDLKTKRIISAWLFMVEIRNFV